MKLLQSDNDWSCLLFSAAMVLDVDPEWLIEKIGHDGSAKVGKHWRGFHLQEIVDVCWYLGKGMMPVEVYPSTKTPSGDFEINDFRYGDNVPRFMEYLRGHYGILAGNAENYGHACAWNGTSSLVFDPRGMVYPLSECAKFKFSPHTFWLVKRF